MNDCTSRAQILVAQRSLKRVAEYKTLGIDFLVIVGISTTVAILFEGEWWRFLVCGFLATTICHIGYFYALKLDEHVFMSRMVTEYVAFGHCTCTSLKRHQIACDKPECVACSAMKEHENGK